MLQTRPLHWRSGHEMEADSASKAGRVLPLNDSILCADMITTNITVLVHWSLHDRVLLLCFLVRN